MSGWTRKAESANRSVYLSEFSYNGGEWGKDCGWGGEMRVNGREYYRLRVNWTRANLTWASQVVSMGEVWVGGWVSSENRWRGGGRLTVGHGIWRFRWWWGGETVFKVTRSQLILEPAGFKWETQVDSQEEHRKKRDKQDFSEPTSDLRRDRTVESPYLRNHSTACPAYTWGLVNELPTAEDRLAHDKHPRDLPDLQLYLRKLKKKEEEKRKNKCSYASATWIGSTS